MFQNGKSLQATDCFGRISQELWKTKVCEKSSFVNTIRNHLPIREV